MLVADMTLPPAQYQEYVSLLSFDWNGFRNWGGEHDYFPINLTVWQLSADEDPWSNPAQGWSYTWVDTGYTVLPGLTNLASLEGRSVLAVLCTEWRDEVVTNPQPAYYVLLSTAQGTLYTRYTYTRLSENDCYAIFVTGVGGSQSGDFLNFGSNYILSSLYSFGESLLGDDSFVTTFVNYDVGGYPLWQLMLGVGFLGYVAWVIVKWAIPV